jgi:hypothetical protein
VGQWDDVGHPYARSATQHQNPLSFLRLFAANVILFLLARASSSNRHECTPQENWRGLGVMVWMAAMSQGNQVLFRMR